ncbi:MAG TPA: BMP family ABC transporter substrate-binding protein [Acidimicrobiales bacterium]|nr:BMP family ABC transporter substrate-binding protein [Acidimicrobiales bacterium]
MRKTRLAFVALVAMFAVVAGACGDDGDTTTTPGGDASSCPTTPEPGDPAGKKVGLLFDITGRGDQSFNDSAACGLDRAAKDFKIAPKEYPPSTGESDRGPRINLASTTDKNELVIGNGFLWATPLEAAAKANPTIQYAIVDSVVELPNVTSLVFAEEQGSYLVGAAAALKTKTKKVGFIGGVENALIKKFEAGFVAGVKAADSAVTVDVKYITPDGDFSGFNAPDKGQEIARGMFDSDIDIIYAAAGSSGTGMFKAAKEHTDRVGQSNKVWGIGVDSDQALTVGADLAPYVLTSMLKRVEVAVYETIKAFDAGTLDGGTTEVFDAKRDGVGYATTGGYVDDIASELDDYKQDIVDGKITVPDTP